VIANLAGGVFNADGNGNFTRIQGKSHAFNNAGTFNRSGPGSTVFANVGFNNTGIVVVVEGTLHLNAGFGGFDSTGKVLRTGTYHIRGTFRFQNADIVTTEAALVLDGASARIVNQFDGNALASFSRVGPGGSLTVRGGYVLTVSGDFHNEGQITLGDRGLFNTGGDFSQTSSASLNIELNGLIPGDGFGRLNAFGQAPFGGILNITVADEFDVSSGDAFEVLTYGSLIGDFQQLSGLDLGGGLVFERVVNPTNMVLVAVINLPDLVVEDLAMAPGALEITWATVNQGDLDAIGGFVERVFVRNLTTDTIVVDTTLEVNENLAVNTARANSFMLPATTSGRYQVRVTTDADQRFFEFNPAGHEDAEQNNIAETQFVVEGPNLVVTAFTGPTDLVIGDPAQLEVAWTVANKGPATGVVASWIDRMVLSTDDVIGNGDDVTVGEFTRDGLLESSTSYSRTEGITLSGGLTGAYFLYVTTDATNLVPEPDAEGDNDSSLAPVDVAVPFADLVVEVVTADPESVLSADPVTVSWRVRNAGVTTANGPPWTDRIVLSADGVLDAGDTELARVVRQGALDIDESYTAAATVDLPNGIEGDFHAFVVTDFLDDVFEAEFENNNTGRTIEPIDVTLKPSPDLVVTAVTGPPDAQPGQTRPFSFTASNAGPGSAEAPWTDRVYLSPDGTLNGATSVKTITREVDLPGTDSGGGTYELTADFTVPVVADGDYRLVVVADEGGDVFEGGPGSAAETNNLRASNEVITIGHPDLQAAIDIAPGTATGGDTVTVAWNVTNAGSATVLDGWVDELFLSSDATLDAGDRPLGELLQSASLAPAESVPSQLDVTLPLDVSGPHFLLLAADAGDAVEEVGDEGNNTASSSIQVDLAPYADLAVTNVRGPPLSTGDPVEVTVEWTLINAGTGTGTVGTWNERIVASSDDVFGDGDDVVLAAVTHTGLIDAGASLERSHTFMTPPGFQGRFVLFVQTDATGVIFENGFEANNFGRKADFFDVIPIPFADLVVPTVAVPAESASGRPLRVTWTVINQGMGPTNISTWNDRVLLADDPAGSSIVATLGRLQHNGVLPAGGSYTRTADLMLPHGINGTFFVVVEAGRPFGPFEFLAVDNNRGNSEALVVALSEPPDLTLTNIAGPGDAFAGSRIDVEWTVNNAGLAQAGGGPWVDRVFLREAGQAGGRTINLGSFTYTLPLDAGKSYTRAEQVVLPSSLTGIFQFAVTTNSTGSLFEPGTANNTAVNDAVTTIALPPRPDLQVLSVNAPDRASAGGTLSLEFVVINQGAVPTATPNWTDRVYLSPDNRISSDDQVLAALENGAALGPDESYLSQTGSLVIPRRFGGDVFLLVQTDASARVDEFPNDDNNTVAVPLEVSPLPPSDLVTGDVAAPALAFDGQTIEVRYTVTNLGSGETDRDRWSDTIWLARDRTRPSPERFTSEGTRFGKGDILLKTLSHDGPLAVGESYEVVTTVPLPAQVTGEFFITPWSDAFNVVTENTLASNINPDDPTQIDNNNYKAHPITVLLTPPADLVVTGVTPGPITAGGGSITVRWAVENEGGDGHRRPRLDRPRLPVRCSRSRRRSNAVGPGRCSEQRGAGARTELRGRADVCAFAAGGGDVRDRRNRPVETGFRRPLYRQQLPGRSRPGHDGGGSGPGRHGR